VSISATNQDNGMIFILAHALARENMKKVDYISSDTFKILD